MNTYFKTLITTQELTQKMESPEFIYLDCTYYLNDADRGRREYLKEHIPGAFFLDIAHDLSAPVIKGVTGRHPLPDPEVLYYTFKGCGIGAERQVVAYDQNNGVYASRAWWLLNWLGFDQVAILNGGFQHWKTLGLQPDNQWTPPATGNWNWNWKVRDELVVTKESIKQNPGNLVDSREYKRYTGETEPIDPVAGHIEGAICIPYLDNVNEAGLWKEVEFLKSKFKPVEEKGSPPVFYCGSGVTACHNILGYKIATGQDAKLYGGSWSEWINYYPPRLGTDA